MEKQGQLGAKIAMLRKKEGMTQKELGEALNISYQAVSKWERGESYPDFDTISKMAKLFGVAISYFESSNTANATSRKVEEEEDEEEKFIGVCKVCGRMVTKSQVQTEFPQIKCKTCYEKEVKAKQLAKEKEEKEKQYREA